MLLFGSHAGEKAVHCRSREKGRTGSTVKRSGSCLWQLTAVQFFPDEFSFGEPAVRKEHLLWFPFSDRC